MNSETREYSENKPQKNQWLLWIIFLAAIISLRVFLFTPVTVNGESMEPTLNDKDKLIISKIGEFNRFDIVVFRTEGNKLLIKRIIGMPGDKIEYINDLLYINGEAYEETFIKEARKKHKQQYSEDSLFTNNFSILELGSETVPENTIFVLGDNRTKSEDSRAFGFISFDDVIGTSKFLYWPLDRIEIID